MRATCAEHDCNRTAPDPGKRCDMHLRMHASAENRADWHPDGMHAQHHARTVQAGADYIARNYNPEDWRWN